MQSEIVRPEKDLDHLGGLEIYKLLSPPGCLRANTVSLDGSSFEGSDSYG